MAQSLKANISSTFKRTKVAGKRIKKLTSALDNTKTPAKSKLLIHFHTTNNLWIVVDLQVRGLRVERLLTNINKEIITLQKEKQDLKYKIDDFYVQLTAANVSQEYKDKVRILVYLN